ncbi:hypothetical protein KIW84_035778 [Lathyrus oleraceus]|uniref:Integrase zinc-binding domain-containing protein n=1 Tax=Pisum sativum TaxID=3888 RepID=A0A9D5B175_PEA|nr:hypothetical protein KIW84_035778 [Pisum sativum]
MAGEQHSDHSRPLVNYNMDDGPPSHEADVRDGHPSTPSPEPQNNGDVPHAHNLGAETFHPIPVPVEGDAVMIAMVNALNQAGSMLHQQHERIMALEAERQEARPQPVSRIQQRPEPTKKRGRRSPEPHASRARAHRDGGRARTSPRRGHSPDNNELSPLRSDEEDLHCPLSRAIMEAPLPKGMEKPPNLAVYDGTTDPDDHEAVEVDTTEHMKKYLLERGLLPGSELSRAVGIEPPRTLNELLHKAQAYIRYEEKQVAHNARSGRNAGETEHSKREDTSISRRNGDRRREERPRELREGRGPAGRYSEYTLLTAPRERILAECINSEFKQGRVRFPKPSAPKPHTDKSKYCRFHRSHGHVTEDCVHLKDAIEILIQEGHLKQYTRKNEAPRHDEPEKKRPRENTPPDNSPYQVALCVSRPEDFFPPEPLPEGKITALSPWEDFPTTLVISGGGTNGESAALSVKRKFDELLLTAPEQKATLTKYRGKSNPISFFLEELPGGSPNSAIPLLIRAKMARFDMKYYTKLGRVVTIHGDIEAARRCYDAAVKGQAVVSTKSNCNNKKLKTEDPARGVNAIDLDCRIGLDETGEGRFPKERSLEHPVRPIPDGEFELIPLGDDPERTVKIGKGLPEETREELVACLKENSDLFAWNAAEMRGLDPEIACHKLAVDRAAKPIAQRRRKQSPEKAEAAERAVKDLLEANFISEAHIDKLPPPLEVNAIGDAHCWMTPIYNYLTRDELPADPKEAAIVKRRACSYVLLEGKLYRRGFSIPLLKCVEEEKVPDVLGEIHRGINAQHLGGRSLARKALRAGYYWPTMQNDSKEHVKRFIPVEIRTPTRRTEEPLDEEMNDETLRAELDLVEEIRSEAALRETTLKQKIALRHDAKVIKREFQVGTLVLRRNQKNPREGKLAANWEGPYRVRDKTSNGAYYLENLQGEQLARPWNAEKLRQYYS